MTDSHDKAQGLTRAVYLAARRRVLRRLVVANAELGQLFEEMAGPLRRKLRLLDKSEAEIATALEEAFFETLTPARQRAVEGAIEEAARRGVALDQETFELVFGEGTELERPFESASGSPPTPKHSLRLVHGSGGKPPSTG